MTAKSTTKERYREVISSTEVDYRRLGLGIKYVLRFAFFVINRMVGVVSNPRERRSAGLRHFQNYHPDLVVKYFAREAALKGVKP